MRTEYGAWAQFSIGLLCSSLLKETRRWHWIRLYCHESAARGNRAGQIARVSKRSGAIVRGVTFGVPIFRKRSARMHRAALAIADVGVLNDELATLCERCGRNAGAHRALCVVCYWADSPLLKGFEAFTGAGDRFRTDDLVLGKHTLYQLSYTRSPVVLVRNRSFIGQRETCQIAAWRASAERPRGMMTFHAW